MTASDKQPISRRSDVSYSLVIKIGYEKICGMREKGLTYDEICGILVDEGLFPGGVNPRAFCAVFLRESKRREKRATRESKKRGEKTTEAAVKSLKEDTKAPRLPVPRTSGLIPTPNRTTGRVAGLDVKPDNTFTIREIDTGDLPEI